MRKQLKAWRGKFFGGGWKGPPGRRIKISPAAIAGIIIFVLCGIALYIRVALPYDSVFVGGEVWFKGADPWYHMRLVDILIFDFRYVFCFVVY
jgi:asparagine N-glycosylation enzyme membrane subunit Stt3